MPLHRDIHWLGRQWAVTGHGLQLINQKQMGYYDIEAARLWEARVIEVQSKAWIDRPDFDKALEIARAKFVHIAPADLPPPAAIASPPSPVRATPPAAPRAPVEPTSVPTIEELLARLKSKSAASAPSARPVEAPAPAPPRPEPAKPELAKPEPAKPEPAKREAPTPEPSGPEPLRSEPPESQAFTSEARRAASANPAAPTPPSGAPVVVVVRRPDRPAWPAFDRKIAGSARFVSPWRVTSARWHGPLSGLPPRP